MADLTAPPPVTQVADNSAFGGPSAAQAAAGNAQLLVTSGASRVNTANNVNSLNAANAKLSPPATGTPGSSTNGGPNAQQNTPSGTTGGITINTGNGGGASSGGLTSDQMNAAGIKDSTGWTNDPKTGLFTPPAGGVTPSSSTNADGTDPTAGLDPSIAGQYKAALANQDQITADAKSTMDQIKATLLNDPAAKAAADAITAKYDVLIKAMGDKNKIILGGAQMNAARTGGLQYANDMTESFMSSAMDAAQGRISDLMAKEQSLILQSNQAYQSGDLKAFNTAQDAYNKANNDKISALDKLLTATNNQVKTVQEQQKIDAAAVKTQYTQDQGLAVKGATGALSLLTSNYGIGDPAQATEQQLTDIAASLGMSNTPGNTELLRSQMGMAFAAQQKAALAAANTADTIANRDAGTNIKQQNANTSAQKKAATAKTTSDAAAKKTVIANITSRFGQQTADASGYSVRGADNYIDPAEYVNAYHQWITKYSDKDFLTNFPAVKLINPASYSSLPTQLQPVAKAGGGFN